MNTETNAVLVVDDDTDLRETLAVALELEGFEVYTAGNGQDAIETLHRMPRPHAVLLDLLMPIMNGWEFLSATSHDPAIRGVPVVIVSTFGELHEIPRVSNYVEKPFDLNDVLHLIRRVHA